MSQSDREVIVKASLRGLGTVSDTLRIDTLQPIRWQEVTGMLSVEGAKYYYVSGPTVGIRYSDAVEVPDFAARCLRVVMRCFGTEELELGIKDPFLDASLIPQLTEDILSRTMATSTPPALPLSRVEPRGTGPAYWLK